LRQLDRWLARLEGAAVVLLLTGLLGLGLLQVILRNLLASGMFWADELLQHIVLWLGFLGASLATREQRHLNMDLLTRLSPARWQSWLSLLVDVAALLICALLTQAAWTFVRSENAAGTVLTFGVPAWLAQSIIPLGFGIISLRFALHFLETLLQVAQRKSSP
jgi:TRAP-type C4-dicarboxylate transport system permease small subunit